MTLNLDGIAQLKADLRANAKHYNQQNFGVVTPECGTEACMAGMCLMRQIGLDAFTKSIKTMKDAGFHGFTSACIAAGADQIGITLLEPDEYGRGEVPPIFEVQTSWPEDLKDSYTDAKEKHDHAAMAEVACAALDRIDDNGCFIGFDMSDDEDF